MILDWNNPIGLGLFLLMVAGTLALLTFALWLLGRVALLAPRRGNRTR